MFSDAEQQRNRRDLRRTARLLARLPALQGIQLSSGAGSGRIPIVRQLAATDCGAACLAMVLTYHGCPTSLEEVRGRIGEGRDGASGAQILAIATEFGLRGRGVRLEVEALHHLPSGSILHWGFNHFVVLDRLRTNLAGEVTSIEIIDPAFGRRRVRPATLSNHFTGVAIILEPTPAFGPASRSTSPLWSEIKRLAAEAGRWPRVLVLSLVLQVLSLALPSLTGAIVDSVVPRADRELLGILAGCFAVMALFYWLASLVRSQLLLEVRTLIDVNLSVGFLEHLVSLPYSFFLRRSTGDLLARLHGMATLRELLSTHILSSLLDGCLVVIYLVLIGVVDMGMVALVLGLAIAQSLIFILTRHQQRMLLAADLEVQARAHSYEVELLGGIETLKGLGCEQRAVRHWSSLYVDVLNTGLARGRLAAQTDSLLAALRVLGPLLALLYGANAVLEGRYSLGVMLTLAALGSGCLGPLYSLIQSASQLVVASVYFERMADVMSAAPEQAPSNGTQRPSLPELKGTLRLDHVSLRYGVSSVAAVDDVSVHIPAGSFVAIVGATGSGKTTLARLLLGLYLPTGGRVLVDGLDITGIDLTAMRQQIGVVTQHTDLFATTIRNNIALAEPTASLDDVEAAARMACIHDDIAAMPLRYEMPLVDRGLSLSGGQRQRLSLARALLRRPAVLLLDEATSALDSMIERAIFEKLTVLKCTRVVIAHRLSTICAADLILVMDQGRIVEQGRHDELLIRGGLYAKLAEAQLLAGPVLANEERQ